MAETTRTTTDAPDADSLDIEDLFATEETASIVDERADEGTRGRSTTSEPAAPEDTTAGELFEELREDHDDADDDGLEDLDEETPADIMARADEATAHVDQIDDAIRADEDALSDLLLTGRRKADGFLWVDTEDDDDRVAEVTADGTEDLGSLFAPTTADAESEGQGGTNGPEETETRETDVADRDDVDGFSLAGSADDSFETRAATFDDATVAVGEAEAREVGEAEMVADDEAETVADDEAETVADDEAETVADDEAETKDVSAAATVGAADDTVDESTREDARSSSTVKAVDSRADDGSTVEDDDSSSDDDGEGSLASRIRSILSG